MLNTTIYTYIWLLYKSSCLNIKLRYYLVSSNRSTHYMRILLKSMCKKHLMIWVKFYFVLMEHEESFMQTVLCQPRKEKRRYTCLWKNFHVSILSHTFMIQIMMLIVSQAYIIFLQNHQAIQILVILQLMIKKPIIFLVKRYEKTLL